MTCIMCRDIMVHMHTHKHTQEHTKTDRQTDTHTDKAVVLSGLSGQTTVGKGVHSVGCTYVRTYVHMCTYSKLKR